MIGLLAIKNWIWERYYWFVCILYVVSVWNPEQRIGLLLSILMLFVLLGHIGRSIRIKNRDMWIMSYVCICFLSVMWFRGEKTIYCFLNAVSYTVLPAVFYIEGRQCSDEKCERFWINTIKALFCAIVVGFVLYVIAPDFYGHFLVSKGYSSNYLKGWIRANFQSVFGLTCTGSFCAIISLYELDCVLKGKRKHIVFLLTSILFLLLTARLSAIVGFVIVALWKFYTLTRIGQIKWQTVLRFMLVFMIAAIALFSMYSKALTSIYMRVTTVSQWFGERSAPALEAISHVSNILIGNGFGSSGHIAASSYAVNDNSYALILCETGVIGLTAFVLFVINVVKSGFRRIKKSSFELSIIFILLLQAVGSNIFEFQQIMPIFWFCAGRCLANREHKLTVDMEISS